MHLAYAYSILLMVVQLLGSHAAFHDAPREERRNDDRNNLHPGRVILYRPVTTNSIPDNNQNYETEKHRNTPSTSAPNRENFRTKSYDYDEYKLPASKYTNDYFQPPRPKPTSKQAQNRVGFAFPDSHAGNFFWAQRGALPQQNLVDYNQNQEERHNFHQRHPAVITYENRDLRKHRPALFQQTVTPGIQADGSNVIVASGPGGIKHIIHDLRVPQQPPINQQKTIPVFFQHGEPKPDFGGHRFTGRFNAPQPQVYKGIPVFVNGGTFSGKEYDPRFVTLYRQVLEENHKRVLPRYRIKTQNFNPSPVFGWYSEPDPLYQNPQFITSPPVDSTIPSTLEPIRHVQPIRNFPDSINSQLPPPTANESPNFQYQASTDQTQQSPTPTKETETEETAQEKIPATQDWTTSNGQIAGEISILENLQMAVTAGDEDAKQPETTIPSTNENETSTQQSTSVSEDHTMTTSAGTVLTSISESITLTETESTSKESEDLSLTKRISEETKTITPIPEKEESPTTEMISETTTQAMEDTTVETTTLADREETMATTIRAQTEAVVSERSTAATESETQPTTTAADMALTTMNFLVMSLVNQARAITSENATTVTPIEADAATQSISVS